MMEPVAYQVEADKYGKEIVWPLYVNPLKARLERGGYAVTLTPLVRLSDAEARVAELEELAKAFEAEANQMREVSIKNRHRAEAAEALLKEAREALGKINDIRNSIIGGQTVNWSEHIYPLVAALNDAGIEGQPYPEAREYVGTMLERTLKAEKKAKRAEKISRGLAIALQPLARLELNYRKNNPSDAVFANGCVYVSDVRSAAAAIRALKEKP